MKRKIVPAIMLTLLLTSMLTLAFNIQPVMAIGTIYIQADGSIYPSTAPIQRNGDIYTLTDNVYISDSQIGIVVQRSHIIIDGAGHILDGTGTAYGVSKGIVISYSSNVTIKNTEIKGFFQGIQLWYSLENEISTNNITDGGHAVDLWHSSNNIVSGNNMVNQSQYIVDLDYSSNNVLSRNNITTSSYFNAVFILYESSSNSISENVMVGNLMNGEGIVLHWSSNNSICGNSISNCRRGIQLAYSNNNSLSRNSVTNSTYQGIYLEETSYNSIYHNSFSNNSDQVYVEYRYVDPSINVWDDGYPSGGNYWSDYTDVDFNNDGIWDHPYIIDADNQDRYPLTNPWRARARGIFDDDFEIYDLGTLSGQGNWSDAWGFQVVNTLAQDGTKSGYSQAYDTFYGISKYGTKKQTGLQSIYIYFSDVRIGLTNEILLYLRGDAGQGGSLLNTYGFRYNNSASKWEFIYQNGSDPYNIITLVDDVSNQTWHSIQAEFNEPNWKYRLKLDDGSWSSWLDFFDYLNQSLISGVEGFRILTYGAETWFDTIDGEARARSTVDSLRFPLDGLWTVRQRFGGYNYDWDGYHLGEDVLRSFEAPVFAPADGVVKHNAKRTGYGYVVIIEHQLMDGTFVCSVLGHLREAGRIPVGARVTKGQIVGYLSSVPDENGGIIHLHFGIRKGTYSEELDFDGKWRYRGYGPIDIVGSWCPPSAFIDYYNLNKETPPSYDLTINTEGGGALAAASSTSVYTLTFKTVLSLIALHPWFQRWIGTDNDNANPTTITMNSHKVVTESCLSEPPPPSRTPWELAIDLIGADYSWGGDGWNWTIAESDGEPVIIGWGGGRFLEPDEIKNGYWYVFHNRDTNKDEIVYSHGIDCSGLVFWAYNKAWGAKPERMLTPLTQESTKENTNPINEEGAQGQYWHNCEIDSTFIPINVKNQLQPGDCLFFDTGDAGNPDHVAMYVGNFLYEGQEYNVTHASGFAGKVAPALYNASTGNLTTANPIGGKPQELVVDYYGRPVHQISYRIARNMFSFTTGSPIDLIVTDPDGIVITKEVGEVAGMSYTEFDLDGDGELDDKVEVWEPKAGNYLVTVIPEPGAPPTGNFTLEGSANGTTILLADHAQISEIPTDPYIITSNGTTIMLRNINIATTNVTLSKGVVGQGHSLFINATVQNQGNLAETLNVTLYANTTAIATVTNITLTSGNSTTITFTWNTTGFVKGNYTIKVVANQVPGETETSDNTYEGGWVLVSCVGDVNGDKKTSIADIVLVIGKFATLPSSPEWNPNMDIDGNDKVTIGDIVITIKNFGEHW